MQVPVTLSAWVRAQAVPLSIVSLLIAGVVLLLKISAQRRSRALSAERAGVTEQTFVDHLAQFNFDPVICGTTYRYMQQVQGIEFPILPSDSLDEDLGLDQEGLEQTVRELKLALRRTGASGLRHQPLVTVEDLIRHLQASPRRSSSAAA